MRRVVEEVSCPSCREQTIMEERFRAQSLKHLCLSNSSILQTRKLRSREAKVHVGRSADGVQHLDLLTPLLGCAVPSALWEAVG